MNTADVTHPEPTWRDQANFLIGARIEGSEREEQIWARKQSDRTFTICCIPYFVYGIALGDVVETDDKLRVKGVVARSNYFVFRVIFSCGDEDRERILKDLLANKVSVETWSSTLSALSVEGPESAQSIDEYLSAHSKAGRISYETGTDLARDQFTDEASRGS